jgi:hypothetical protein
MGRFFTSLLAALVIGAGIGLYLGWVQFPAQVEAGGADALAERYKEDFALMIAAGFQADADANAAAQRLRLIGVTDAPSYIQMMAERAIANSIPLPDIQNLVALAEAMNRLTPAMQPYRRVALPESSGG